MGGLLPYHRWCAPETVPSLSGWDPGVLFLFFLFYFCFCFFFSTARCSGMQKGIEGSKPRHRIALKSRAEQSRASQSGTRTSVEEPTASSAAPLSPSHCPDLGFWPGCAGLDPDGVPEDRRENKKKKKKGRNRERRRTSSRFGSSPRIYTYTDPPVRVNDDICQHEQETSRPGIHPSHTDSLCIASN